MPKILWDASGLIKRYLLEVGSRTVDELFSEVSPRDMFMTPWGYAETHSILIRRFNSRVFSLRAYNDAVIALQSETTEEPTFNFLPIPDTVIYTCISLVKSYNINSTDAAILSTYLRFQAAQPAGSSTCVLAASDKRLIRAADAEGLPTLNPESVAAADVSAFLAAL